MWIFYALVSAVAASVTAILAKLGVAGVSSNVATAFRTLVVLVLSLTIVFATGDGSQWRDLKARSLLFLVLSGLATGVSWLAYFKALQLAPVSRVAPIDKLSLGITIIFSAALLGETVSWRVGLGAGLIVAGALLTLS